MLDELNEHSQLLRVDFDVVAVGPAPDRSVLAAASLTERDLDIFAHLLGPIARERTFFSGYPIGVKHCGYCGRLLVHVPDSGDSNVLDRIAHGGGSRFF